MTNRVIEIAQQIAEHIKRIDSYKRDLVLLDKTGEFTTVIFNGEDGAECGNSIRIGWDRNSDDKERYAIAKQLHIEACNIIQRRIEEMERELEVLVERIKQ